MRTLKDILENDISKIRELARDFGFSNVRLFIDRRQNPPAFHLVVSWDPDSPLKRNRSVAPLADILTETLKVDTCVILYEQVTDPFSKKVVDSKIIDIDADFAEIEKKTHMPLEKMFMADPDEKEIPTGHYRLFLDKNLKRRREALQEQSSKENGSEPKPILSNGKS